MHNYITYQSLVFIVQYELVCLKLCMKEYTTFYVEELNEQ